jgi:hypothetical protein
MTRCRCLPRQKLGGGGGGGGRSFAPPIITTVNISYFFNFDEYIEDLTIKIRLRVKHVQYK